ncbi:hypothetical protein TNCV_669111 [Trichonephila clavipes]|nr:hypothetical protein TNCV_669111 [Trichonephila clavipes]
MMGLLPLGPRNCVLRSSDKDDIRNGTSKYHITLTVGLEFNRVNVNSPLVSMEKPLRTAYGQAGRCGMQPKPSSLRAQAHQRTELQGMDEKLLPVRNPFDTIDYQGGLSST